ncbi:hypothetical protein HanPSC8_Chr06g0244311 [Helianthus annuus]|nr:hypothetical protein HanPSC8_Chr06g0244311 [Helianthus annuus]
MSPFYKCLSRHVVVLVPVFRYRLSSFSLLRLNVRPTESLISFLSNVSQAMIL